MGRDKAFIVVDGETLAARTARIAAEVCNVVVVVGAPGRALPPLPPSVVIAFDDAQYEGPLSGIVAGLAALPARTADHALVVGVDMPRLDQPLLCALLAAAPVGRAVATARPGGLVPLPTWIPMPRARASIAASSQGADRSLTGWLRVLDVYVVARAGLLASSPELAEVDPELLGLEDADDATTLAALIAR